VAKPAIEERMSRYSAAETHFALMSIARMRSSQLQEKIGELERQIQSLEEADAAESADQVSLMSLEIENLRSQLEDEGRKKDFQREENARRKHNYIPFICQLIDALGEKDALTGLMTAKPKAEQATK